MKRSKKICDTSIRVLETLKYLSFGKASIQEIIKHFERIDPNNRVYTNEVILKYINTLKVFGIKFKKEKDKYVMLNSFEKFFFSENDLRAIAVLQSYSANHPEQNVRSFVGKFLQELEVRFDEETRIKAQKISKEFDSSISVDYSQYAEKIALYEKYCLDGQKIKIISTDSQNIDKVQIVEPSEIKYIGDKVYLRVYNQLLAEVQDVDFASIREVNQLPQMANNANMLSSVTFRLKDNLSRNYKLREGEKLVASEQNGDIIVLNKLEDRKLLLKRLMRYGENCEVISPKYLREEMKKLIEMAYLNYA